jgi:RNA polymerase sigma factor for flagellar operon FliA
MNSNEYQRMILEYLPTVKIIALKILARLPVGIELNDLIHSGILGLIDAVKRYDPTRGTKFATYASLRIRGAILDELRNLDWASRSLRQRIKEIEHGFVGLEMKLGRAPDEEEMAQELGVSLEEFQQLLHKAKGLGTGLYRYSEIDGNGAVNDRLVSYYSDEDEPAPDLVLAREEMKKILAGFVEELPEKEKLVLNMYYLDDLHLKEIAQVLHLTESRISQIRTAAILRLRGKIARLAAQQRVQDKEVL